MCILIGTCPQTEVDVILATEPEAALTAEVWVWHWYLNHLDSLSETTFGTLVRRLRWTVEQHRLQRCAKW